MIKNLGIFLLFICGSFCAAIPLSGDAERSDNNGNGQVNSVTHANVHAISASQKFFDSVPAQDKEAFIVFHLWKALLMKNPSSTVLMPALPLSPAAISEVPEPDDFSQNLLSWVQQEYQLQDNDVEDLITYGVVCINGKCYNPLDVGSMCCIW